MSDFYETLGVSRDASADEIKRSYRKLARELHPDVNPDPEVQDKFKEITAAYETLSDPKKRQNYDMGGSNFGGANFGGGFSDIMDAFFGGGGSRGPRPRMRAGQDSLIRIQVDLHEACFGVERDISVESAVVCPKVPVITTRGGCFPEAAGPGSVFVDPDNAEELADAIRLVLNDEAKRKEMIATGYAYAQQFKPAVCAENMFNLYKKICAQ